MKLIKEGDPQKAWWVGRHVTCDSCGQIVELQAGDQHGLHLAIQSTTLDFWCSSCLVFTKHHRWGKQG